MSISEEYRSNVISFGKSIPICQFWTIDKKKKKRMSISEYQPQNAKMSTLKYQSPKNSFRISNQKNHFWNINTKNSTLKISTSKCLFQCLYRKSIFKNQFIMATFGISVPKCQSRTINLKISFPGCPVYGFITKILIFEYQSRKISIAKLEVSKSIQKDHFWNISPKMSINLKISLLKSFQRCQSQNDNFGLSISNGNFNVNIKYSF